MKKLAIIFTALLIAGCSSLSDTGNNQTDELGKENNSLFTFRNIQSGLMLHNGLDQHGRETTGWEVVPVNTPVESLFTDQSGWVMIRTPNTDQCLGTPDGRNLLKMDCNPANKKTLFSFIPSTTGAVQIKIVFSGLCVLDSKNSGLSFETGNCIADLKRPFEVVPQSHLWMLNPLNTESPVI
ncbi:toxin [Salmonella enterica]|nr:toxin [Salmonella enterica]ECC9415107.1 toxin [Salmonella enterica subsp. enterica]EHF1448665.1 toxin [Salmonella enterica subsp. enterica serovar 4,5,12:b:-]EHG1528688.1 toxin [Salmonella enterica subsp. enterica serovar 4,[5],12:b:-]EHG5810709.1 toxin [Salmonella enterica subsp. enterica serovar Nottingham]EHJ5010080.1 toxin [Salmonella enterica subsp. enterica serovar Saintpaul]